MSSTRESLCMCDLCRKRAAAYARIEAFGAIRRAVKVAHWYDDVAKGTDWLTPEYIEDCKESARAVRWAIRAAIGSEEA